MRAADQRWINFPCKICKRAQAVLHQGTEVQKLWCFVKRTPYNIQIHNTQTEIKLKIQMQIKTNANTNTSTNTNTVVATARTLIWKYAAP